MKMPECVLQAYLEQIPRLRAERALEAAGIGALPWLKDGHRRAWYDAQQARLGQVEPVRNGVSVLTWNGAPLGLAGLKAKVAGVLQEYGHGSGIST